LGFLSLQHLQDRRSTCRGLSLPATFRLQGLVTLLTVSSLRTLAGSVSHRQRSWDSPFGAFSSRTVPRCYHSVDPTYRFTCRCSRRRSEGPAQQASVPGILPCESPWWPNGGLGRQPLDAPLGFAPSRVSCRRPGPRLPSGSPLALCVPGGGAPNPPAPQGIDRLATHPILTQRPKAPQRTGQPF
jgi:hypothetical protein